MSGARVPFAAARDRLFPAAMAHIHPRFQSPSTALVAQGLLSTLLLLLVGRFQQLFELAIFAEWLFYLLTTTTIFVYRRRVPAVGAALPQLGISGLAGAFHSGRGRVAVLLLRQQSTQFAAGNADHSRPVCPSTVILCLPTELSTRNASDSELDMTEAEGNRPRRISPLRSSPHDFLVKLDVFLGRLCPRIIARHAVAHQLPPLFLIGEQRKCRRSAFRNSSGRYS